ncbi:MAG: ribonuclease HII [bacterium]
MQTEEYTRIQNMLTYEKELWNKGLNNVVGVDEAGRGPLAGPVVAAAVIFTKEPYIPMIDDSKRLSAEIREFLYDIILKEAFDYGIGLADVKEIDKINIYQASFLAMERALDNLNIIPDFILVDGRAFPNDKIPYTAIVKGDSLCFSIAAASILAKVTRDRIMCKYDEKFPHYGFAHHKGYPTRAHLDAIEKYGYCKIHRQSFHPKRFLESSMAKLKNAE